ncbi:MAG: hypothetical protein ACE5HN_04275 [Nitrospiria bacterium]
MATQTEPHIDGEIFEKEFGRFSLNDFRKVCLTRRIAPSPELLCSLHLAAAR